MISIVITACNNAAVLSRCLDALVCSRDKDFEIIVVDDASHDGTSDVARRFTDKVIVFESHRGVNSARMAGYAMARGDVIVNLDSDVLVFPDTLDKIRRVFASSPEVDAVTGILSKQHSFQNFSSQYKNLYMHYIFSWLPRRVTFLYGSLFAFRRALIKAPVSDIRYAGDTLFGQQLWLEGRTIILDKSLEVEHLKQYDLPKLMRNDFEVPFYWAHIFLRYSGVRQLGKNGTGFAHASLRQLMGVGLSAVVLVLLPFAIIWPMVLLYWFASCGMWFVLNGGFLAFLFKERGAWFAARAALFTFLDQIVMLCGIMAGFVWFSFRRADPRPV
jgi:glycosyltransferase involved in cell wall biosynthesis